MKRRCTCSRCGKTLRAPLEVQVLFHNCRPRRTRRWAPPDLDGTTPDEAWTRTFSDFAGGLQPPTPKEARAETGESGRRKEGIGRRTTPQGSTTPHPRQRSADTGAGPMTQATIRRVPDWREDTPLPLGHHPDAANTVASPRPEDRGAPRPPTQRRGRPSAADRAAGASEAARRFSPSDLLAAPPNAPGEWGAT